MTVYHGSICEVSTPDLSKAKGRLDFGKAFYVTSYRRQAEKWARRKAMRMLSTPVVSTYQLADDFTGYRVLDFKEADSAWSDFVCACRAGKAPWRRYDIIKGRVANDDVFKTVDMLSGGERALTAIAILFAMLKLKPTPFCILDEIEAALDEVNVERLAQYIKKYTDGTQFIMITHRRGTMAAATRLYGVTMPEHGISKVLTLDVNDIEKQKESNWDGIFG